MTISTQDRIRAIADSLDETTHGNPRLRLDVRFYDDGHVSLGTPGTAEHVQRDDLASAIVAVADIIARAGRKASA